MSGYQQFENCDETFPRSCIVFETRLQRLAKMLPKLSLPHKEPIMFTMVADKQEINGCGASIIAEEPREVKRTLQETTDVGEENKT